GVHIENPYRAELPVDNLDHELVITAEGYEPLVRHLRGSGDVELRLSLETEAGTERKAPRVAAARTTETKSTAAGSSLATESAVRSTPSSDEIKPGADLKRKSAAPRST